MAPDFTNRTGVLPTGLMIPGVPVPKPPHIGMTGPVNAGPNVQVKPAPSDERTCYVQNSKNGDILNILPMLYHQYEETKQKQVLMVSKEYAGLLTGCSYIEPLIWGGDWTDLNGALRLAQETFKKVVSLSTYGKSLNLTKQTPSFALEQWRLGGHLTDYGRWPLVFDQRNSLREGHLVERYVPTDVPLILFADHSHSSPFARVDDLIQMLRGRFNSAYILRLSEVKAEQIYDLLALYDRADVLVSVETMHLHLAAASAVPVVALVTDRPELWHGTAWRGQFVVQCRYGDYDQRKEEIVRAIEDAMASRWAPPIQITGVGGYNQSILDIEGKRMAVYRWHPKPDLWRTELAGWNGSKSVKILPPKGLETHSIEDGRLFVHNGKVHLSYTVAKDKPGDVPVCAVQYAELDMTGEPWKLVNHKQPIYEGNDFSRMQKNWSFFSAEGKLYAAYERSPEQVILELDGDRVVKIFRTKTPDWQWGQIRGGTMPIPYKGLWLQFFHSSTRNRNTAWGWTYYMGALLMETEPPFQIVSVSRFPILAGTERYFPVKHWKPRVLFPAGGVCDTATNGDKTFLVSVGVNDAATGKVELSEADLNL